MKLVSHAAIWHKLWSIRLGVSAALMKGADEAYRGMHPDWAAHLPQWLLGGLGYDSLMTGMAATVAVVVRQTNLSTPLDTPGPTVPTDQRLPPA